MFGTYANIGGKLMGSMLPYIAYMDPMGYSSIMFNHSQYVSNNITTIINIQ